MVTVHEEVWLEVTCRRLINGFNRVCLGKVCVSTPRVSCTNRLSKGPHESPKCLARRRTPWRSPSRHWLANPILLEFRVHRCGAPPPLPK